MDYKDLIIERGRITRLILNRPDKRNSMSRETMIEMEKALWDLNADPSVVVIIMSGAGKGFCAGGDLEGMIEPPNILDSREMKSHIMGVLTAMGKIDKIIISQVHGFALAGGFGVAVTADLTVVTDDCKLGMPEIKRGITPMNIMNPVSRCMPRKRVLEMMFTGDYISPQQALEWGLVNRVVPAAELEAETIKLAESIACNSGSALMLCKNAFYNMQDMEYYTAFNFLTDMLTVNTMTEDAKEGIQAFFEKRQPKWLDR